MNIAQKHLRTLQNAPVNRKPMDADGTDGDGIDRISSLPNEVLCHILSFLPTKYAVGTSILSTRWKNLFPLIPNLKLELDDSLLLHPESTSVTYPISFVNFVDRLLNITLLDVPSIFCLSLVCQKFNDGRGIANWIRAALCLNVKRMELRIHRLRNSNFLFDSLFGCNLVSLNLLLDFSGAAPEYRFSLPNLKMLCVQYMKFDAVNVLLGCCPSLEYLVVHRCYCYTDKMLRICIPSLKTLRIVNGPSLVNGVHSLEGEYQLDVPNLEYLSYDGYLVNHYVATKMNSLQMAILDHAENIYLYPHVIFEPGAELVEVCSDAEKLWLSGKFFKMIHRSHRPLPRFQNLVVLGISNADCCAWGVLPSLIDAAPKLKNVVVESGFDKDNYLGFKAFLKKSIFIRLSQRDEKRYDLEIQREAEN